jgi:tetratricopeptide (TPR) repeat protein
MKKSDLLPVSMVLLIVILSLGPLHASEERDRTLRTAVKAYNAGNYSLAIKGFESVLQKFPEDPERYKIKKWLAFSYVQAGDKPKAFSLLKEAFRENSSADSSAKVFKHLIKLAKDLDKLDEISDVFQLLKGQSKLFVVRKKIQQGYWNKTLKQEIERLGIESSTLEIWINRGVQTLWNNRDYQGILSFLETIPDRLETKKVRLYFADSYLKLLSRDMSDTPATVSRKTLSDIKDIYRSLTSDERYQNQARYALGWIYYQEGNFRQSQSQLARIVAPVEPPGLHSQVIFLKANNYRELKDYQKAVIHYKKALRRLDIVKQVHRARLGLSYSLSRLGHNSLAREFVNLVDVDHISSPIYYHELQADVLTGLNQHASSLDHLREALTLVESDNDHTTSCFTVFIAGKKSRKLSPSDRKNSEQPQDSRTSNARLSEECHANLRWSSRHKSEILRYRIGKNLYAIGKLDKAYEQFESLYQNSPPESIVRPLSLALVRTAVELNQYEKAIALLNKTRRTVGKNYPYQYWYFGGVSKLRMGDYQGAYDSFRELFKATMKRY